MVGGKKISDNSTVGTIQIAAITRRPNDSPGAYIGMGGGSSASDRICAQTARAKAGNTWMMIAISSHLRVVAPSS
jgi:hypothetical protein